MNKYKVVDDKLLLTLINGDTKATDEVTVSLPVDAEPFVRHFRWIDFRGNHVTPDVIKSGLFHPTARKDEDIFASLTEMVKWYLVSSEADREEYLNRLDITLPLREKID